MIVRLCLLWSCTLTLAVTAWGQSRDELPNFILCMGDDHGWEETGYNGHPYVKTPILDEMAASGLRLERFYAGHPTCSPTRGSVLTGRHPNRYGTLAPNFSIRPEEITIAALLKQRGYTCGHFGKWHVGPVKADSPTSPGALGFDQWLSHDNFFELNPSLSRNGAPPEVIPGESSAILVDAALDFALQAQQQEQPFLIVLWFGSPHEPYSGLPEDLSLYDELPQQVVDRQVKLTSNETGKPTERALGEVLRERYAEITAMDRAMGKLRDGLTAQTVRENTLIWYCGDNGTPPSGVLASPLRGRKAQVYEGGIRVPGIIEWPARIRQPRTSRVNAVTSDILPTLCNLVDCPLPDRPLDGVDLTPLIDGHMDQRPQPIYFWDFPHAQEAQKGLQPYLTDEQQRGTTPLVKLMHGIATRNFVNYRHPTIQAEDYVGPRVILHNDLKLILGADDAAPVQLFDLSVDPAEARNLVDERPALVRDLMPRLRDWQTSVLHSLTEADY